MWSIGLIDNELPISEECGKELEKTLTELDIDLWQYYPKLEFNSDHMEHMDFLWQEEVQEVLAKHKVNGRVTFGSMDGDNAGDFWGYEWKDGELTHLTGHIEWTKNEPEEA